MIKRHLVSIGRHCSLIVISFKNLERADHYVKILDYSISGLGLECDQPIEPGIVWFKERVYGQRCGFLLWREKNNARYRGGIQFISLTRTEEEYLRQQIEQVKPGQPVQDPEQIIPRLIPHIKNLNPSL